MPKDLKANLMSNTIINVIQKFMIFKKIESDKKRLKLKYADLVEFERKIKNSERKMH